MEKNSKKFDAQGWPWKMGLAQKIIFEVLLKTNILSLKLKIFIA